MWLIPRCWMWVKGAPGGECANSAISNMTNIYHMYFVFSPFFSREGPHVLAGTISALFACKNTSSRNCISHRKQKVVMFVMAMSPWGSSLLILGCGLSPAQTSWVVTLQNPVYLRDVAASEMFSLKVWRMGCARSSHLTILLWGPKFTVRKLVFSLFFFFFLIFLVNSGCYSD